MTSAVELVGVAFGVLGVLLTIRQSIWCWPAGLVNVTLFVLVFFRARLYGAMALQLVYIAVILYGWYAWLHGGEERGTLRVSRTPRSWAGALGAAGMVAALTLGLFLRFRTDAALPFWDASTTSFSLVAQWMTTRKWIENWLVWIVVDVVYVGMYLSQHLYPTAALYATFLVLAVLGYREWLGSLAAVRAAEAS